MLGFSLRESGTKRTLLCMVTKGVSDGARGRLRAHYHDLVEVETMDSNDADSLALLGRPELGLTFTKLFAWQLTDYEKVNRPMPGRIAQPVLERCADINTHHTTHHAT